MHLVVHGPKRMHIWLALRLKPLQNGINIVRPFCKDVAQNSTVLQRGEIPTGLQA